MIITGKKLPGTRLKPVDLEKELDIGKVPIREALLELAESGLVVSEPYRGVMVAPLPSIDEITEVFEIRYLLEAKAAATAVGLITDRDVEEIDAIHQQMLNYKAARRTYFELNHEFHARIYQVSKLNYLCSLIHQLINKVHSYRVRYPFQSEDFDSFNRQHEEIMDALRVRDADTFKHLIVQNVKTGCSTLIQQYKRQEAAYKHG
jgi:DNA-binding GntR family transcriptional regulator